jgi:hypothetical protein
MSDTPRTDAAAIFVWHGVADERPLQVVDVNVSRTLERELAAVTRERDEARTDCLAWSAGAIDTVGALRTERDALERERDEAKNRFINVALDMSMAHAERNALRAEVERLRGALSDEKLLGAIARGWCSPENSGKEMDVALAFAIADSIQKTAFTTAEVTK